MKNQPLPPQWLLRLFRWYCHPQLHLPIEGDLIELYIETHAKKGKTTANLMLLADVLLLFRPGIIKDFNFLPHSLNRTPMLQNFFKVSIRGMMRHPLNSFINVFGLSVAIGIAVFAYAFAQWTYSTDQFHEHKDKVFLVTTFAERDGTQQQYGTSPMPLAPMMKADLAQITKATRIDNRGAVIKNGDFVFHERVRLVDADFLGMFTFPLKWGDPKALFEPSSIILSENMAIKYFGNENPIGKDLLVKFEGSEGKMFTVAGVAEDFPTSCSIEFDFLANNSHLKNIDKSNHNNDWSVPTSATFVMLDHPQSLSRVTQGMDKYRMLQNDAAPDGFDILAFEFKPLATLHVESEHIRDYISWSSASNYESIVYLAVVSGLLLLLACLNYINISLVSASKRLKEIGIRKTIGANRQLIIGQFLVENVFVTSMALILGVLIGWVVVIPWFEKLWNFSIGFRFDQPQLYLFLGGLLVLTGIASGVYPSIYVARFQTVSIMKGSVKFGSSNPVAKFFMGAQLFMAMVFMTTAVMFTQNTKYLGQRSWGYDPKPSLYAVLPDKVAYEQLEAKLLMDAAVVSLAGGAHHLGKSQRTALVNVEGKEHEVAMLAVGEGYLCTIGANVLQGAGLCKDDGHDKGSVVVNQLFAERMGWAEPIGKAFKHENEIYHVAGLVENIHHQSFYSPVKPTFFTIVPKEDYRYMAIKVKDGGVVASHKALQQYWAELFPETPFNGGFQDQVWGYYFEELEIHGHVWRVFAIIAIFIACLGLYGLVTFNIAGRAREFSIRKVLGAGLQSLASSITRQYWIVVGVALTLGMPVSYFMGKNFIESIYTYHMPVTPQAVLLALAIMLSVLFVIIAQQIWKVVQDNPVKGLKVE